MPPELLLGLVRVGGVKTLIDALLVAATCFTSVRIKSDGLVRSILDHGFGRLIGIRPSIPSLFLNVLKI